MSIEHRADDQVVDPTVSCANCDAVCCRLTVVLMPGDDVPAHLIEHNARGVAMLARNEDGWCAAVDRSRMQCSIYEQRPTMCRKFHMGSAYCRSERDAYARRHDMPHASIPIVVIDTPASN